MWKAIRKNSAMVFFSVLLFSCMGQPKNLIFRGEHGEKIFIGKDPKDGFFGVRLVSKEGSFLKMDFDSTVGGGYFFPRLTLGEKDREFLLGYYKSSSIIERETESYMQIPAKIIPPFLGVVFRTDNTKDQGVHIGGQFGLGYSELVPFDTEYRKKKESYNPTFANLSFLSYNGSTLNLEIQEDEMILSSLGKTLFTFKFKKGN